jgi:predicted acetyltransferase
VYLCEDDDGEVEGYVVYSQHPPEEGAFGWTIRIRDWVALTESAMRTLFWAVGSQSTQAETVRYLSSPEDALLLLLDDQHERVWGDIRWMTRMVDLEGAIAQRGFANALDLEVPFSVEEVGATAESQSLAANAGSYRLLVSKGEGRLERSERPAGPTIGVGGFASLYTGWAETAKLDRAGLLTGGSAEERAALDLAFAGPTPWLSEEF